MTVTDQLELGEVLRRIARRWRVVLMTMLLAVAGAALVSKVWPVDYEATSIITVSPTTSNPLATSGGSTQQVNIETERVVAGSPEVAVRAVELMPSAPSPELARDSVRVTVPEDSQALEITYTAGGPLVAADGANAFAQAYLGYRQATAQEAAASLSRSIEGRIEELQEQLPSNADDSASPLTIALQQQIVLLREQQGRRARYSSFRTVLTWTAYLSRGRNRSRIARRCLLGTASGPDRQSDP
jgi:uncharacterized protein involved in exopolysaccharide biosynthesis